jgi:hypothetical protein
MQNVFAPTVALACTLAFAGQAGAHDVTFTGFAHGSETVHFSVSAPNVVASGDVYAGGFATVYDGSPSFVTYCVDLYQHIAFNTLYPEYTAPGTTHVFTDSRAYTDLGRLYAEAGVVNTAVEEAAFQIAVWEIAYEKSTNPYNLSSGAATFSGGTAASSGALNLASTWLAGLGAGTGPGIEVIESRDHQDVIFAPVPEPSSLALMLAGLVATVGISRRASARQTVS